jgi:phasin family protein
MSGKNNPFFDFDISKMMSDFKIPGVSSEDLMESQRKHIEAATAANQVAIECIQAVTRRQAEIVRQSLQEVAKVAREAWDPANPEKAALRQTEFAKQAFERAISNAREIAEMVAKSNREAFDIVNKRVAENLDEVREVLKNSSGSCCCSASKKATSADK